MLGPLSKEESWGSETLSEMARQTVTSHAGTTSWVLSILQLCEILWNRLRRTPLPPRLLLYVLMLSELSVFLRVNSMTWEGRGPDSLFPDRLQYFTLSSCHLESLLKEWTLFWIASVGTTLEKASAFSNHWGPTFYMVSAQQKRGAGSPAWVLTKALKDEMCWYVGRIRWGWSQFFHVFYNIAIAVHCFFFRL